MSDWLREYSSRVDPMSSTIFKHLSKFSVRVPPVTRAERLTTGWRAQAGRSAPPAPKRLAGALGPILDRARSDDGSRAPDSAARPCPARPDQVCAGHHDPPVDI